MNVDARLRTFEGNEHNSPVFDTVTLMMMWVRSSKHLNPEFGAHPTGMCQRVASLRSLAQMRTHRPCSEQLFNN